MLRIGLTGGIGSGKSTVCQFFAELNVPVIDTDAIAHDVVAPGQDGLKQLVSAFGTEILDKHGQLDRALLRERVFRDEAQLKQLESILHPLIRIRMHSQLQSTRASYVIIAIPLLLEKGWQTEIDRILVVDTEESLQIERTARRDAVSPETVQRIMHVQVSRCARLEAADDVIHNNGTKAELKEQVERLHKFYLQLAAAY